MKNYSKNFKNKNKKQKLILAGKGKAGLWAGLGRQWGRGRLNLSSLTPWLQTLAHSLPLSLSNSSLLPLILSQFRLYLHPLPTPTLVSVYFFLWRGGFSTSLLPIRKRDT